MGLSYVEAARRDREGPPQVREELARALPNPYMALRGVAARANDKQVTVLATDNALERPGNGQISLDDRPGAAGEAFADLGQHVGCLFLHGLPTHLVREGLQPAGGGPLSA